MLAFLYIALFAAAVAVLAGPTNAHAYESPGLAAWRDWHTARICATNPTPRPPINICKALVAGTHTATVQRRWALSRDLAHILLAESGFRPLAVNPADCGAGGNSRGLFQLCDSTWIGTGCRDWRNKWTDPAYQAKCGFRYIKNRYGNPAAAWRYWQGHRWY